MQNSSGIPSTSKFPCIFASHQNTDGTESTEELNAIPNPLPPLTCVEDSNSQSIAQSKGKGNLLRMLNLSKAKQDNDATSQLTIANSEIAIQRHPQISRSLALNRMPAKVKIVEVGARDGLQNEKLILSPAIKVELINKLSKAGFVNIEAGSFVSSKWVPQMANSEDVMKKITRQPGVVYSALTPNLRGFEAAMAADAHEVVIFGSASESFAKRNINCSIAESFERFQPVADAAKKHGVRLRGSISCAFDCPTEGKTPLESVMNVVRRMRELGCDEIDIADTTGKGTPEQVREVMQHAAQEFPIDQLSGHFHDTYGHALDNIQASMEVGISIFHSSVAGLGGCPYAQGATGNVATEDVLALMRAQNIETGVDMDKVVDAGQFISHKLNRPYDTPAGKAALQ